ncbi:HGL175Wp [Eremothecium sinecaudum]|uniref:Clathrin light chain n=1 Tax=Eremothecium sinecaudum TaxID=45286 RepID=A0A0X8HVC4_9SACH|nr:HGL175Wp [Eremothecium sinecaudum]AMD22165.1 HGL175Wp [Eremothecium sinecaudum]
MSDDAFSDVGSEDRYVASDSSSVAEESKEIMNNWKKRRELEIEERDRVEEEAKRKLQEEAEQHINDFYDVYNKKKQHQLEQSKAEAEQFLKEREEFFNQDNTLWDRVLQLINVDDADQIGDRDRSKFKEILLKLQGDKNAPGLSDK